MGDYFHKAATGHAAVGRTHTMNLNSTPSSTALMLFFGQAVAYAVAGNNSSRRKETDQTAQPTLPAKALGYLVGKMNAVIRYINTGMEFSMHDEAQQTVVKLIDKATSGLIRQFPLKVLIAVAESSAKLHGMRISEKA